VDHTAKSYSAARSSFFFAQKEEEEDEVELSDKSYSAISKLRKHKKRRN